MEEAGFGDRGEMCITLGCVNVSVAGLGIAVARIPKYTVIVLKFI